MTKPNLEELLPRIIQTLKTYDLFLEVEETNFTNSLAYAIGNTPHDVPHYQEMLMDLQVTRDELGELLDELVEADEVNDTQDTVVTVATEEIQLF